VCGEKRNDKQFILSHLLVASRTTSTLESEGEASWQFILFVFEAAFKSPFIQGNNVTIGCVILILCILPAV
jgi:hypothetical protein